MIEALYIIGSAFTLLVLAHRLRDLRQQLRQATWERDSYAEALHELSRGDYLPATVVRARLEGPDE
jgi:hypothetical protein